MGVTICELQRHKHRQRYLEAVAQEQQQRQQQQQQQQQATGVELEGVVSMTGGAEQDVDAKRARGERD